MYVLLTLGLYHQSRSVQAEEKNQTMIPFTGAWSTDGTLKAKVSHPKSSSKTMQPNPSSSLSPFLSLHVRFNFFSPSLQNFNKQVFTSPLMPFPMPSRSRQLPPFLSLSFSSSAASEFLHKFPFPPQDSGVLSCFFQVILETQLFNIKFSPLRKDNQTLLVSFFFFPLQKITEQT